MPWHIEENRPECEEPFAVIDDSDDSVAGCYPTELDAQDAIDALMAAETPATNADDLPDSPHDDLDAILPVEVSSAIRSGRADKVGREERRGGLELRDMAEGSVEVYGYASRFGVPYSITDMFGEYEETVEAGAFARSIDEADVRLYVNHDGMALARSSVNLELREDSVGLAYSAKLDPSVSIVSDLAKLMRAGIMRESSFAFQPIRQEWNADYTARRLLEVKLYDVSVVSLPASPTADAGIRHAELVRWLAESDPLELAGELRNAGVGEASVWDAIARLASAAGEVREGKVLSATNAKLVRDAVDALNALLESVDAGSRDADAMMLETAIVSIARRKR